MPLADVDGLKAWQKNEDVPILFGTHFAYMVWTSSVSGETGLRASLGAGIITAWIPYRFTNTILRASST
jgi:hypothetical protein